MGTTANRRKKEILRRRGDGEPAARHCPLRNLELFCITVSGGPTPKLDVEVFGVSLEIKLSDIQGFS